MQFERQRLSQTSVSPTLGHLVRKVCAGNGTPISENQFGLLVGFTELLRDWNERVNLLSRNDVENIWTHHILHSLSFLFCVDIMYGASVLDLGSGGGFPGIPLGIVRNDLKLTLLDSIRKKTTALEYITQKLELRNISVVTARAEELVRQQNYRFDIVIARGVASLTDLINWSRPLMARRVHNQKHSKYRTPQEQRKVDTPSLLALKGGDLEEEVQTAKRKTGEQKIATLDLIFEGSQEVGLEGKKLVIVEF